jgi:AraC-like DNA-binding protein
VEGPEQEIKHYTSNHTLDWGVHFRADVLKDADRTLWNADGMALPCAWAVYSTPPEAMADLMHHLNRMLDLGPATPALLESPDGCKLEQECIRALVVALSGPTEPPERLTLPARSELVGRAEEFLRTRLGETVGMIDLCRAIGANARTLRLAFQERYGLGPMTYFRSLRLNAARRMLRENEDIMIADVAREFGFHHLGNFAADYRRLFGVLPSKTRHPPAT